MLSLTAVYLLTELKSFSRLTSSYSKCMHRLGRKISLSPQTNTSNERQIKLHTDNRPKQFAIVISKV